MIAAQNAVVAAEALGLGSCYIGDIVENAEAVAALLDLPPYTMPLSMLIISTPVRSARPLRIRSEPGARGTLLPCGCRDRGRAGGRDGQDVSPACPRGGERVVDIHTRKHTSPFMAEMSRSMEWWFKTGSENDERDKGTVPLPHSISRDGIKAV